MASQGISTTLSLVDKITPSLKKIKNGLHDLSNNFRTTAKVGNNSLKINTSPAVAQLNKLQDEVKETSSSFGKLKKSLMTLFGAYVSFQTVGKIIETSDTLSGVDSRLGLMVDKYNTLASLQKKIMDSANRTGSAYIDTADAVAKLGIQAGHAFSGNDELIAFTEQLNKHMRISNTSQASAQGAMIQMVQALSSGVLRGDELQSVRDGMPTVAKQIEEYFHKIGDKRDLKSIAEDGLITVDRIKRAVLGGADETDAKFEKVKTTFITLWTLFKNRVIKSFAPLFDYLSEIANNKDVKSFVEIVGNSLVIVAHALVGTIKLIIWAGKIAINVFKSLFPVIATVTALVLAWKGIVAIVATAKVAFMSLSGAIALAKTAVLALNTAFYANPAVWIISAIMIAIVAAIGLIIYFSDTWEEGVGNVAGGFSALFTHVGNVLKFFANRVSELVEFFVNVWSNPWYSLKKLYIDWVKEMIDIGVGILEPFDKIVTELANKFIRGFNKISDYWFKVATWWDFLLPEDKKPKNIMKLDEITSVTENFKVAKDGLDKLLGEQPEGYKNLLKFEYGSITDSFSAGKKFGEGVIDKAKTFITGLKDDLDDAKKFKFEPNGEDKLLEIAKNTKATAKNTSQSSYEEDLKYLRDIAEREAINRFTTAEIKVDLTNNNSISNGVELGDVAEHFRKKLEEALRNSAEAVHF